MYNTPKFNSKTQIEWEIRADVDDWGESVSSFIPWKNGVSKDSNSVRVIGRDDPLHTGFVEFLEESQFSREWEEGEQSAMLSISIGSSGTLVSRYKKY